MSGSRGQRRKEGREKQSEDGVALGTNSLNLDRAPETHIEFR
jgi:hypothetical protein